MKSIFLPRSGMFQNDVENNIADIAATIENFFEQFVEILENDYGHGAVIRIIEIPQNLEHDIVGLALDTLELIVLGFYAFQIDPLSQFLGQEYDGVSVLLEHAHLFREIQILHMGSGKKESF